MVVIGGSGSYTNLSNGNVKLMLLLVVVHY
jgi:hypothetical protein